MLLGVSYQFDKCGTTDWTPHGSTIFKGTKVPVSKYPWQSYLYANNSGFCGGALISKGSLQIKKQA